MPPNATDNYVILKPQEEWPDPRKQIEAKASELVGHVIDFSQPIQMRFNELIAGVREDLAVMVFGEEFETDVAHCK
jgi:cobalt-zinc-cadmium resistance protein CzcA